MKSQVLGKNISDVEIQNISPYGLWLFVIGKEYFLSFQEYPGFKNAKLIDIYNVEFLNGHHLYWSNLDVDIELEALEQPEKYPLMYK